MYSIGKLINVLRERGDIPLDERVRILTEVENTVLCPCGEGHPIDLRELPSSHIRSEEFRCPDCREWIKYRIVGANVIIQPYPKGDSRIRHPDKYNCIVPPGKWYDQDLNEVIKEGEKGIPLEKFRQNLIPLGNGYYAVPR